MSTQNVALNTGVQAIINSDTSKIFVWNKEDLKVNYTNTSGSEVQLVAGTVMGEIAAAGDPSWLPNLSTNSDGTEVPRGVLMNDITVPDGESRTVSVSVNGHIVKDKLIWGFGDAADTLVDGVRLDTLLMSQSKGILLVGSGEQTNFDNQ